MAEDERYLHAGTFLQRLFFPPLLCWGLRRKGALAAVCWIWMNHWRKLAFQQPELFLHSLPVHHHLTLITHLVTDSRPKNAIYNLFFFFPLQEYAHSTQDIISTMAVWKHATSCWVLHAFECICWGLWCPIVNTPPHNGCGRNQCSGSRCGRLFHRVCQSAWKVPQTERWQCVCALILQAFCGYGFLSLSSIFNNTRRIHIHSNVILSVTRARLNFHHWCSFDVLIVILWWVTVECASVVF